MTSLATRSAATTATRRDVSQATRGVARQPTRAHRALWRVAAIAIIWATSLFVTALWVSGGGIQAIVRLDAESLNTIGRLTGLVSANLLLYQVLLMARVPVFERGFGRDGITRMHRKVGFWSFWLMFAHIILLVLGYAALAAVNPFVQLWDFVWNYPGMLLATAGSILLVMVVVTSIRRARRALRYESWHLLHLYAYLGVGLAIPHMLWTGADFVASPAATVYWWGLWIVAAASVVLFRIGVPLWRSARHGIRVESVTQDGPRTVTVRMSGRRLGRLHAEAGQFFVWRFRDGPGWTRGHPFSLAAAPTDHGLVIAARVIGDGTSRMTALQPGTKVMIEGPYGHLTGRARSARKLLMIGAGAGVAPLIAILEAEPYETGEATLLTRDHSAEDAMGRSAVGSLVAGRGLVHRTLNGPRGRTGATWLPATHSSWRGPDLIRYLAPDLENYDVFLCGPIPWMNSVTADLRAAGVTPERIHSEAFTV